MKFINSENKRKFAAAGALTLAIAAASFGTFANATDDNKFEVGIPAVGQETVQAAECVAAETIVPAEDVVPAMELVPATETTEAILIEEK